MSKLFFKGRQDPRESHKNHGYETKATFKPGSKKYPLELVVTNEQRKSEVAALVAKHELFATISLNTDEDAEENIADLTGIINKPTTVSVAVTPNRNEPCHCGSGKKFKKCCA